MGLTDLASVRTICCSLAVAGRSDPAAAAEHSTGMSVYVWRLMQHAMASSAPGAHRHKKQSSPLHRRRTLRAASVEAATAVRLRPTPAICMYSSGVTPQGSLALCFRRVAPERCCCAFWSSDLRYSFLARLHRLAPVT